MPTVLIIYMTDGSIKVYGPCKNERKAQDLALHRSTEGNVEGWSTTDLLSPDPENVIITTRP
jgi:hypothetical protein